MVIKPEIDLLLEKVDSKYTLCIISARRARQINDMAHGLRDQALLTMPSSGWLTSCARLPATSRMLSATRRRHSSERYRAALRVAMAM